jgi:hypothetical protein
MAVKDMNETAPPTLGHDVRRRFPRPRLAEPARQVAVGRLARGATQFSRLMGRSLAMRSSMRARWDDAVPGADAHSIVWQSGRPQLQAWVAWSARAMAERELDAVTASSPPGERGGVVSPYDDAPPRALPGLLARGAGSLARPDRAPAAAPTRFLRDPVPVRRPAEVVASGPMLTRREAGGSAASPRYPSRQNRPESDAGSGSSGGSGDAGNATGSTNAVPRSVPPLPGAGPHASTLEGARSGASPEKSGTPGAASASRVRSGDTGSVSIRRPKPSASWAGTPTARIRSVGSIRVTRRRGAATDRKVPGSRLAIVQSVDAQSIDPRGHHPMAGAGAITGVTGHLRAQVQAMRSSHAARAMRSSDAALAMRSSHAALAVRSSHAALAVRSSHAALAVRSSHAARASLALDGIPSKGRRTVDTTGQSSAELGLSESRSADGGTDQPTPDFAAARADTSTSVRRTPRLGPSRSGIRLGEVATIAPLGTGLPAPPRGARRGPGSRLEESYPALQRQSPSERASGRGVAEDIEPTTQPVSRTASQTATLHSITLRQGVVGVPQDSGLPSTVGDAGPVGRTPARIVMPGSVLHFSTTHPPGVESRAWGMPTVAGVATMAPPGAVMRPSAQTVRTGPAPGLTQASGGGVLDQARVSGRRVGASPLMSSARRSSEVRQAVAIAPDTLMARRSAPLAWSPGALQAFHPPPAWRPGKAPPAPADVFTRVLRALPPDPPETLPGRFVPLARAVADAAPVSIRSGPAARRALSAVGKPAATIGRVVHLAARPDMSPRSAELIAHELVHVSRPSSAVRFFDDERRSDEESLAREVGGLARALASTQQAHLHDSAWSVPAQGLAGLSVHGSAGLPVRGRIHFVGAHGDSEPIQRAPAMDGPSPRDRLASSLEGIGGPLLQRLQEASTLPSPPSSELDELRWGDRSSAYEDRPGSSMTTWGDRDGPRDQNPEGPNGSATAPLSDEDIERILDALEDRVLADLERRGLRYDPGVF